MKRIIILAIVAIAFSACQKSEDRNQDQGAKPLEFRTKATYKDGRVDYQLHPAYILK